ncbi:MAG: AAA family ATPase [Candidatus Woesearchaeota archaeon]
MSVKNTKKPVEVTLEKGRKKRLDELMESWSMDQKKFILQSLNSYSPPMMQPTATTKQTIHDFFFGKEPEEEKRYEIEHLTNTEIFRNPIERYKITGKKNPRDAFHEIFNMEITSDDRTYLKYVLEHTTDDVYVPQELIDEFEIGHRRHHHNLLTEDRAPKMPFYLVIGPTGSGKTKTINRAIERALFDQGIEVKQKVPDDLEDVLKKHPIMARLDLKAVAPEAAERMEKEKRKRWLDFVSKIPFLGGFYQKETAETLEEEETEFGMSVDVDQINPNNVQTMWYGETGNKMMQSFGSAYTTSIRILEEAHALLRVHQSHSAQVQEDTLVSTFNIILDQIEKGERNCMVIALTRKGDEFHSDIYRRFQEKGRIIDMSDYWKTPDTIEELVKIEALQQDIEMPPADELRAISEKVLEIFEYRGLDVTPAYVRKLVACIAEIKGNIVTEYFEDGPLVRDAFVNVARNLYPEMFKKTYNRMQRNVPWDEYVGDVKEEFQRLANQCLVHGISAEKGVVLAGAPGTGKTFLARAYLSRHTEISDVTLKMEDLQDDRNPIDGPVRKLAETFDIAKMCAPTLLFVDEGEAVAMERQGNMNDRIPNKLLNAIDGETELKGVFVALTTNKPEHLAEAATRSGRLKIMPITGKLTERDIYKMLNNFIPDQELSPDLSKKKVYAVAKQICATPADYSKFFETIINFREEERLISTYATKVDDSTFEEFMLSNYKALLGIVESLGFSEAFIKDARKDINFLINHRGEVLDKIREAVEKEYYPVTSAHLDRAKADRIQAPALRGKITLDDYLESQLSSEPQIGFVIGAGASETTGMLVPISTSLVYGEDHQGEKIVVTGAVNVDAPQAAQLNAAVEMMRHSSKEALTLVLNYLSSLVPEKDIKRLIGTYMKDTHLHHQFLTARYMGGGPSAGMALAINTLSVILDVPVRNDFGITGAPWSRGKTKDNVGSAVIIGGTDNKSQVVLSYLDRMYVPHQNLKDVDKLVLDGYWRQGKDVVGYQNFPSIIGEVYCWGKEELAKDLFEKRVEAKRMALAGDDDGPKLQEFVDTTCSVLRLHAEKVIRDRMGCIERYVRDDKKDAFLSLGQIFEKYKG